MRSLHVIGSTQMGGAEKFFIRLVGALHERDHSAIAVHRPGSPVGRQLGADIPRYLVPMRNGWDVLSGLAIRRLIRETGVGIVQTYMGRASRLTRVPEKLGAVHIARLGGFYKVNGYYRHANAWIGNTRELCDYLVGQGLPAARIFRIGNFVEMPKRLSSPELAERRRTLGVPEDALVVFSLGRFLQLKGFDLLIEALAQVPAEIGHRPVRLVLAGEGPMGAELKKQAAALGLDDRICWAGWQSDPTALYQMSDVFVCPSRRETLGNVILEAWANGLPVLSTETPAARELIQDGTNGLTSAQDSRLLARAACRAAGGRRRRLAPHGRCRAE